MSKIILLDIEGTISPISFVKNKMFPYSKENIDQFIKNNKNKKILKLIKEIKKEIVKEIKNIENNNNLSTDYIINFLKEWIDKDRKITPLKELQGYIWEKGFKSWELKAPIYQDAFEKIKEWKYKGIPLYIYSSGSVKAQKLFLSHTTLGNIVNFFEWFFDTKIGSKKDKSSYEEIAKQIWENIKNIIFLSDDIKEIEASNKAWMKVIKVSRPEDTEYINNCPYEQITSFNEINL